MHNCKYCDRELKSKAGQLRHESSCEAREKTEEELAELYISVDYADGEDSGGILPIVKDKVVQLEVLGGEETYYDGHPRRVTKLKGLLSRTFDKRERYKIRQLIVKVESENV